MIRRFENTDPQIDASAWVDATAVVIGDVQIAAECSIWPTSVIRGDVNFIRIDHHSNIQDGSVLHVSHANERNPGGSPLVISHHVTVGHKVILHGCEIGHDCLIGMGAVVMDDAVIEPQVMVGANTLVPPGKRLQSGNLYLGNPCRLARKLSAEEIEYLRYSAEHYVRLKNRHLNTRE